VRPMCRWVVPKLNFVLQKKWSIYVLKLAKYAPYASDLTRDGVDPEFIIRIATYRNRIGVLRNGCLRYPEANRNRANGAR
jgi:hypothetical protein